MAIGIGAAIAANNTEIEEAIGKLALAKTIETEAEILKEEAKAILLRHMSEELKKLSCKHGEVVYIKAGVSKKFNKEKAAQVLLTKGVAANVIQEAYADATKSTPRDAYVKFIATKKEGE